MFAPPPTLTRVLTAGSSPACMASFFVTAFAKGDFAQAWAWSDDPENAKSKAGTGVSTGNHPNGAEKTASADATGATAEEPKKKLKKHK